MKLIILYEIKLSQVWPHNPLIATLSRLREDLTTLHSEFQTQWNMTKEIRRVWVCRDDGAVIVIKKGDTGRFQGGKEDSCKEGMH